MRGNGQDGDERESNSSARSQQLNSLLIQSSQKNSHARMRGDGQTFRQRVID
jgi:hypothetical protein